jgi:hypothetical protein
MWECRRSLVCVAVKFSITHWPISSHSSSLYTMSGRPTTSRLPFIIFRIAFVVSLVFTRSVLSLQPATLPFHDCFTGNVTQKLNISTVYAQVVGDGNVDSHLNLTVFGTAGLPIMGSSNDSLNLGEHMAFIPVLCVLTCFQLPCLHPRPR